MNSTMQFLAWVSGLATLLIALTLIGAMVVAITKMRQYSAPSKWLLAAAACNFVPMVVGIVLRMILAYQFTPEQFGTYNFGIGIVQSIFAACAIALFVTAVYSDRNVAPNNGEEFLSGSPSNRSNSPVEVNPFESPQS